MWRENRYQGPVSELSEHIDVFKEWVRTLREDIETLKTVIENEKVDEDARKFAACALNYLVTRMDLVPDWEESIGVLDDAMVLRICITLSGINEVAMEFHELGCKRVFFCQCLRGVSACWSWCIDASSAVLFDCEQSLFAQ